MIYSKKLYGTAVINGADLEDERDTNIELEYYGTKNGEIILKPETKLYGIEVIKRKIENKQLKIETQVINNLCKEESEVQKILEILMSNKVTPIGVKDVLEDIKAV